MFNPKASVYQALKANTAIREAVGNRLCANGTEDGGIYPSIYYGEISNVPAMVSDNAETFSRSTIRVTILHDSGSVDELAQAVENTMLGLGWMRKSYTDVTAEINGRFVQNKVMDFVKNGGFKNE